MLGKHSVAIGIRGYVYRDVSSISTSTTSFRTESFGDFIKSITVNESISFPAFKELVLNAYLDNGLPVDPDAPVFILKTNLDNLAGESKHVLVLQYPSVVIVW